MDANFHSVQPNTSKTRPVSSCHHIRKRFLSLNWHSCPVSKTLGDKKNEIAANFQGGKEIAIFFLQGDHEHANLGFIVFALSKISRHFVPEALGPVQIMERFFSDSIYTSKYGVLFVCFTKASTTCYKGVRSRGTDHHGSLRIIRRSVDLARTHCCCCTPFVW